MKKYVLKRILMALVTLLVILLVLFALLQFMPGSPFNDEKLTPAQQALLMSKYGLDQPVIVQFFNYVTNMLQGDLGVSYNISKNTPIAQLLETRLPTSLRIGVQSVLLGTIIGLILGIVAALKHNSIWDTLCTIVSVLGVSVPSYVFALFLAYTLGFKAGWFPQMYQMNSPFISSVLPSIALSMFTIASIARFTRSEMLEVLDNFERALGQDEAGDGFKEGMEMIFKQLRNVLEKSGLAEIAALGEEFDPNFHNAVMKEETEEYESGKVSGVMQKGYTLNGKVIRPSMVKVAD